MVVICDDFGTEFVVREFVVRPLNIMVGRKIFPFVQNPMISYCHVWWREGKVNTWDLNLVVEPRASFPIHGTKRSSGWWFQPLWKILVNWDHYSQYMEKKKCSKPPTSHGWCIWPNGFNGFGWFTSLETISPNKQFKFEWRRKMRCRLCI